MAVLLVCPGLVRLEPRLTLKVFRDGYAPLCPGLREVIVLEGIVETDGAGVLQACGEVDMVDAGPVNRAHTHWARCTVDVDVAPLEHAGALRHGIGRAGLARDHFEDRAGAILATHAERQRTRRMPALTAARPGGIRET